MNIKKELESKFGIKDNIYLNDIDINPLTIKAVMINEAVPLDPSDDFYGKSDSNYIKSAVPILQQAGAEVHSIDDILKMGIYITNAVKTPKTEYTINKSSIENSLPYLEEKFSLFTNTKVIMLMGDTAKKLFKTTAKKLTKKNVIPSISTYKLRNSKFYYNDIRVIPSYIITGGNLLI